MSTVRTVVRPPPKRPAAATVAVNPRDYPGGPAAALDAALAELDAWNEATLTHATACQRLALHEYGAGSEEAVAWGLQVRRLLRVRYAAVRAARATLALTAGPALSVSPLSPP